MSDIRSLMRQLVGLDRATSRAWHVAHVNPSLVEALALLGYGRDFVRAEGTRLWDAAGDEYLDFLASYGTLVLGHNHPEVIAALEEVLKSGSPAFMHISPQPLVAALAERLARLAPGDLSVSYFMSSGAEAVEAALKLARAVTGRPRFVSAARAFHGLTLGALSVSHGKRYRAPFEPLMPGCAEVPWGDADAVVRELRTRDVAAVILEPIQAEGGIRLPPPGYLAEVQRACRKSGTLLVLDEVQTGLGRTGRLFACEHEGVEPDVLVLAKALSGGLVPVSATITTPRLWKKAYGTLSRFDAHSTTFSGGALACAAALATLEIVTRDRLPERAAELGAYLGQRLAEVTRGHPLVREVRGRGLLWGIEVKAPGGVVAELSAQWLAVGLMQRKIATQATAHAAEVIRAEPALIVTREEIDTYVAALADTLAHHSRGVVSSVAQALGHAAKVKLADRRPVGLPSAASDDRAAWLRRTLVRWGWSRGGRRV